MLLLNLTQPCVNRSRFFVADSVVSLVITVSTFLEVTGVGFFAVLTLPSESSDLSFATAVVTTDDFLRVTGLRADLSSFAVSTVVSLVITVSTFLAVTGVGFFAVLTLPSESSDLSFVTAVVTTDDFLRVTGFRADLSSFAVSTVVSLVIT